MLHLKIEKTHHNPRKTATLKMNWNKDNLIVPLTHSRKTLFGKTHSEELLSKEFNSKKRTQAQLENQR